jgi:hypothetical protein
VAAMRRSLEGINRGCVCSTQNGRIAEPPVSGLFLHDLTLAA